MGIQSLALPRANEGDSLNASRFLAIAAFSLFYTLASRSFSNLAMNCRELSPSYSAKSPPMPPMWCVLMSVSRSLRLSSDGYSTRSATPTDEVSASGAIRLVADQDETAVSIESLANFESIPSSSVFSVRQAIETSLIQNLDLVALRQTEGISAAALGVAETYQFNPWVQVQATPYQEARVGGSGRTAHYALVM